MFNNKVLIFQECSAFLLCKSKHNKFSKCKSILKIHTFLYLEYFKFENYFVSWFLKLVYFYEKWFFCVFCPTLAISDTPHIYEIKCMFFFFFSNNYFSTRKTNSLLELLKIVLNATFFKIFHFKTIMGLFFELNC